MRAFLILLFVSILFSCLTTQTMFEENNKQQIAEQPAGTGQSDFSEPVEADPAGEQGPLQPVAETKNDSPAEDPQQIGAVENNSQAEKKRPQSKLKPESDAMLTEKPSVDTRIKMAKIKKRKQKQSKKENLREKETQKNLQADTLSFPPPVDQLDHLEISLITEEVEDKNLDLSNLQDLTVKELDLSSIEVEENKEVSLSIDQPGWILKSINPPIIQLLQRKIFDQNTLFVFLTENPGQANLVFHRYHEKDNILYRKSYRLTVTAKKIFEIKQDETAEEENTRLVVINENAEQGTIDDSQKSDNKKKEKSTDFRFELANNLFAQNKIKEAKLRYLDLINEGNADPEIMYKMGVIERDEGNLEKAKEYFFNNLAEQDNIHYIRALLEYIKILKKQKEFKKALDSLYNLGFALELSPENAEELYLFLADLYYNMNDYVEASKEYRRFIQQFPDSFFLDKALFYLAYSLENLIENPDYKEAYRIYKSLIQSFPESRYYHLGKNRMLRLSRHYLKVN